MQQIIRWNKDALRQFDEAIFHIEQHSHTNAENVKKAILHKIDRLKLNPEINSPDKLKLNNDGSYRVFEMYHYRIAYRVLQQEIQIIRIRHTKMNPLKY